MNAPHVEAVKTAMAARHDRLTRLAATALITPIALLFQTRDAGADFHLVSTFGVDMEGGCAMAVAIGNGLLQNTVAVDDTRLEQRFHDAATGCSIDVVAYANVPVLDAEGALCGSLCVIDTRPRQWASLEIETLQDFALLAAESMHCHAPGDVTTVNRRSDEADLISGIPAWFAEHSTLGLAVVDAQGRCLWANTPCTMMLGSSLLDMLSRTMGELFEPLQQEATISMTVAEVLQGAKPQSLEMRIPTPKGEAERFMGVSIHPIERDGRVDGAGLVLTETSDRRQRERDLRLAEERLTLACEAANVGLWYWDLRTNVLDWTERCRGIFGFTGSEPVDYDIFSDLVHPDDKPTMQQAMQDALASHGNYRASFRVLLADGTTRWVDARGRVLADMHGEPAYFMGAMVDVTELKEGESLLETKSKALLSLNDKLSELVEARTAELQLLSQSLIELAEKEKEELARELHDELGALLTVAHMEVAGALRRLTDKDSELYKQLTRARETIQETTMLKRRVVEGLRPALLDSLGLAESVRALIDQHAMASNLTRFKTQIPDELPGLSHDLSIVLYRIAQESLTNVAKYAAATEVFIRLEHKDGSIVLEIADNGRGLPEDYRQRATAHGIAGMQQRAAHFRGVFSIMNRTDGAGTRVTAVIPA